MRIECDGHHFVLQAPAVQKKSTSFLAEETRILVHDPAVHACKLMLRILRHARKLLGTSSKAEKFIQRVREPAAKGRGRRKSGANGNISTEDAVDAVDLQSPPEECVDDTH